MDLQDSKVKGTIHWVPAPYAQKAEVRLYENLVDEEKGVYNEEDGSLNLNPNSLTDYQRVLMWSQALQMRKLMIASSL